jgi:NADPH:quinone reductase-like Zn-dependent oxidoreductase
MDKLPLWVGSQSNFDHRRRRHQGSAVTMRRIAVGNRAHFTAMNRALLASRMKPVIDRVFPFADTVSAFRYFEAGNHFGKVIIDLT